MKAKLKKVKNDVEVLEFEEYLEAEEMHFYHLLTRFSYGAT